MTGVSEAYVIAMAVMASKIAERPFPPGLNTVEAGDWKLTVNVSGESATYDGTEIGPYDLVAQNQVYLVIAVLGPAGGMVGGMTEDKFIEEMKAIAPAEVA